MDNKIKIVSVIFEILMKNMRAHQITNFCSMKLREGRFVVCNFLDKHVYHESYQ